jgi:hypothetical protein
MSISRPGSPHGTAWFPPQTWAAVLSGCSGLFLSKQTPNTFRNVLEKAPLGVREDNPTPLMAQMLSAFGTSGDVVMGPLSFSQGSAASHRQCFGHLPEPLSERRGQHLSDEHGKQLVSILAYDEDSIRHRGVEPDGVTQQFPGGYQCVTSGRLQIRQLRSFFVFRDIRSILLIKVVHRHRTHPR